MIGIIGGAGFIGRVLVSELRNAGGEVRIIDLQPPAAGRGEFVRADVRDRAALTPALAGCEIVYNLAAVHRDDVRPVSLYQEVNVGGAENTCAAAEAHGIERIVFASSVAIYGASERELDEDAPPRPFNEYGRTKLEAETVFEAWVRRAPGRSLSVVRPTVVFGPGNRGNVYQLLDQIARGRSVIIGDGRNRKSMAYVDNVAAFLAHVRDRGPGIHAYNYVDKPDLDMNRLIALATETLGRDPRASWRIPYPLGLAAGLAADLVAAATGRSLPVSAVRVRKFCANTQFANRRALATGFVPRVPLEDALRTTIRHEFGAPEPTAAPPGASRSRDRAGVGTPDELTEKAVPIRSR